MIAVAVLWVVLAAVAAWGSVHFAHRDPRPTSWMKIGLASLLLAVTGAAPLWLRGDILGEGLVAHVLLLTFWTMILFGIPLCFGSTIGAVMGAYGRDRRLTNFLRWPRVL